MSDDVEPERFGEQLEADLHQTADRVDGAAVTRTGVAGAVQRRRRRAARTRAAVGAVVAVVALVGLAAVATSRDERVEQVSTAASTTVLDRACSAEWSSRHPAGWFRLSAPQTVVLLHAGAITRSQADQRTTHAVLLTHRDLQLLSDPPIDPIGRQLLDLGYEDSAGLDLLRSERLLTAEQEAAIAARVAPVLDQTQVDRVFDRFPTLAAIAAGGQPFPTVEGGVAFAPSGSAEVPGGCGVEGRSAGSTTTSAGG